MSRFTNKILFDQQDHKLLRIVNEVLNRDKSRKHYDHRRSKKNDESSCKGTSSKEKYS